ncbi:MAG: hypothetical protein NC033_06290 [Clostridiales bacterium]|nr:hypothetical protein [Clostridiales bacterium]
MHKKLSTKTPVHIKKEQRYVKVINNLTLIRQKSRAKRGFCAKHTKKLSTIQKLYAFYRFTTDGQFAAQAIKGLGGGDTP